VKFFIKFVNYPDESSRCKIVVSIHKNLTPEIFGKTFKIFFLFFLILFKFFSTPKKHKISLTSFS